jgi:putative chitinase
VIILSQLVKVNINKLLLEIIMELTLNQFTSIFGSLDNDQDIVDALNTTFTTYEINTTLRICAFLAQAGHESQMFTHSHENLNYSAAGLLATFPTHFSGAADAAAYDRQPEKIANRVYASRMGNGDEESGDGWLYRGRGYIQVSGKYNYGKCADAIGIDCLNNPDLLLDPSGAAMSAGWFWDSHNLNALADTQSITAMTKIINGGTDGIVDRLALYGKAKKIIV